MADSVEKIRQAGPVWETARKLNGGTPPKWGQHGEDQAIGAAIINYRQGSDVNGQSPEEFLGNLRTGWEDAGFGETMEDSNLWRKSLLRELTIIDVVEQTGSTVSDIRQAFKSGSPADFVNIYKKMTPEQQVDYRKTATTEELIRLSDNIRSIGHGFTEGELEKQKKAEAIDIRNTIEAGDLDGDGNEKKWKERKFYHEDLRGTTGYKDKIGLVATQSTFWQTTLAMSVGVFAPENTVWVPNPALHNLYEEKSSYSGSLKDYKENQPPETEEPPEGSVSFSEQCFLVDNMEYVQNNPHTSQYKNFTQVEGGDPKDFLNKLIAKQNMQAFVNATPEELSGLVPHIKLWKVLYPDQKSKGEEIPLKFKNSLGSDIDTIMNSKYGRGDAVGIKSFEWNLAGTNAVEASRLIESNLVLYFQDINALESNSTRGASFLDLIYRNSKYITKEEKGEDCESVKIWNEKYYRMKIQVGWASDGKLSGLDLKKTFFLTLIDHEINFKDNGTIELSLRLQSQIEGLLSSPNSDILLMDRNQQLVQLQNELSCYIAGVADKRKAEKKKGKNVSKKEKEKREENRKQKIESLKNKIKAEREDNYRAFLTKVEANNSIHFTDVPMSDVRNWNSSYSDGEETPDSYSEFLNKRKIYNSGKGGSSKSIFEDKKSYEKAREKAKEEGKEFTPAVTAQYITKGGGLGGDYKFVEGGKVRIHYIYLGSILEAALSVHNENKEVLSELRNIVGNIELKRGDKYESSPQIYSLADIPVSLKQFTNWYYDQCISKDRTGWNLSGFLKSLTGFIIKTVKSDCMLGSRTVVGRPRVELRPLSLPLYSNGGDRLTNTMGGANGFNKADKKINGLSPYQDAWRSGYNKTADKRGKNKVYVSSRKLGSYLVLSVYNANRTGRLSEPTKNRRRRDEAWGIYHFKIGMDRGLLKNISFKKMDDPMLEAARYIEEGNTLGGMVRRYNATVDMYGNNLFQPGSEIFLDTSRGKDVGSISHKLGLGGYYMVRSVNSSISSGEFTTSLDCIFISSGKEKARDAKPVTRITSSTRSTAPASVSNGPINKSNLKERVDALLPPVPTHRMQGTEDSQDTIPMQRPEE